MRWVLIFLGLISMTLGAAPKPQLSTVEQVRNHWAFKPIINPPLPAVDSNWGTNEVDRFVLSRLQEKGWKPSARADRRTLIRRAAVDLTGLLPTYQEVQQFVADDSPDAWTQLINRLLT